MQPDRVVPPLSPNRDMERIYDSTYMRYVPVKDDPIDVQVAKELNNGRVDLERVLRIFVREKQGVYSLGHQ